MFWSDATHLTAFGNAKLWPCYMFFGNESKYRRCKPSCNLCSHVAYFQTVCCFASILVLAADPSTSYRTRSRILPQSTQGARVPIKN
jgi:hypothetical protein